MVCQVRYTPQRLKHIRGVLGRKCVGEYQEALDFLTEHYGARITYDGLEGAFKRARLNTPRSYMRPDPVDPVQAYEQRRTEREEKTLTKELLERLRMATERQAFLDNATRGQVPVIPRTQKTPGVREMTAVALMSDLHVEEEVQPIEPFEAYNLIIAGKRLERLFQGIVDLVKHHRASNKFAINHVKVWFGGDFMTGYLHEDNVRVSQLSPSETSLWLKPRLIGGLRYIQSELDVDITVPCSFGNHGRTTIKPLVAAAAQNSFEWLLYHTIADQMAETDKRIRFHITKAKYQYTQAYDFTLMWHHGDDVRYQGGILGPGVPFMKAVDAWNTTKHADFTHIGHLHNYNIFGRGVMNGSLIGHSPYSMSVKARKEDPCQAFYLLDSKRGMCMNTRIWVGEGRPALKLAA